MRNKKIFPFIIVALAIFTYSIVRVSAISYEELQNITFDMDEDIDYDAPVCTNDEAAGDYTIKWNGQKLIMGAIYNKYMKYDTEKVTLDEIYDTSSDADDAEKEFLEWHKPACCDTDDPKDGGCKGSSACVEPKCTKTSVNCVDKVTGVSGNCNCGIVKSNGKILDLGTFDCSAEKSTCDAVCDPATVIGGSCSSTTSQTCKTRVQCSKTKLIPTGEYVDGERNIYTYYYEMDVSGTNYDGDDVYCVQPGAHGPGEDGLPYVMSSYDITDCKDQFTKYNSETNRDERWVYCGLAHIMYQTYNFDTASYKFTTFKSSQYNRAALILALRLWMVAYGKDTNGPGLGSEGAEEEILGWIPKEDFYEKTVQLIKNKSVDKSRNLPYDTSNAAITRDKVEGRIGCSEKEFVNGTEPSRCIIDQAIELFHNTEVVSEEDYLGGLNFKRSAPTVKIIDDTKGIQIEWDDESSIQVIQRECTDFSDPKCIVEPHAYIYQDGKMIDVTEKLKFELDFCRKNTCRIIPKGITEVCIQGGSYIKVVLVFKTWHQGQGEIKFYKNAIDANKYQIMMSMGVNLKECEQKGTGKKEGRVEREIDCGCPNKCTDLSSGVTRESDTVCNSLTTVSDATMDCITHACDSKAVADYNVTNDYSVDHQICTLYEREENELYTPGIVSVYSGMQFSYDLAKDLAKRGITVNSNKKLTSVIIQKKQITSQIHYDYWLAEYQRKLALYKDSYEHRSNYSNTYRTNAKNDLDNWIKALKNCNMYTGTDMTFVNEMENKINALVSCTDASCNVANVAIEYKDSSGEKKYGEKQALAVERNRLGTSSKYYCYGSSCYNYSSGSTFTEPNDANHTENITYYNCSVNSCTATTVSVPTNAYATSVYRIEHDYYNNKKYYAQAYTGSAVSESGESGSTIPLADYSYPISGNTKTSISGYPVQFYFTDLSNKKLSGYSTTASCFIKVYNTTKAYDCKITDSNGNMDLSNCEDTNYEIVNGVPSISEDQISWTTTNKKQYGFVARFIDLDNPFPSGLNRSSVINWTTKDVEEIKKTANDIFTNPEYLEYSYILTPTGIKNIKEYNSNQISSGGYQNSTLSDCKTTSGEDESGNSLLMFTECRSTFLHDELRKYDGVEISGNKAGAY